MNESGFDRKRKKEQMNVKRKEQKEGGQGEIDVYWWRNILQCLESDQLQKCHDQLTGAHWL